MQCPDSIARARRRGFTLIELMVVMGIMAMLSAMIAVAVGNAEDAAVIAHTRAVITRIHTLLMDRYESYRWRRLPIQIPPNSSPQQAAQYRCDSVRELMRLELPDRFTDITDPPAGDGTVTVPRTAASMSYLAAYQAAGSPTNTTYQGADCLYMIVTMGLEENDVLENFSQSDIGTDPNIPGMPCFIDAWGNPIQFLRWAPGFQSPLQPGTPTDRDQTDPTGVYGSPSGTAGANPPNMLTFALYPLIYSAGLDGYYDILADTSPPLHYANHVSPLPANNPFLNVGTANAIGTPTIIPPNTTGSLSNFDNIHNQDIGVH